MSSELRDLYQEVVLEHSKHPRNYRVLDPADRRAEGFNPLCGDQVSIFLKLNGEVVSDVTFQGTGCAISKASASLMTGAVKGKTIQEVEDLFGRVHKMVTEGPDERLEELGKLAALSGVWEFPARVKCASLAWHTLRSALRGAGQTVSTE